MWCVPGWRLGMGLRIHESEREGGEGEEALPVVWDEVGGWGLDDGR